MFIDSRGETRSLMVNLNSRFHYLRHIGVDASSGPTIMQDLIGYALMAGFVP